MAEPSDKEKKRGSSKKQKKKSLSTNDESKLTDKEEGLFKKASRRLSNATRTPTKESKESKPISPILRDSTSANTGSASNSKDLPRTDSRNDHNTAALPQLKAYTPSPLHEFTPNAAYMDIPNEWPQATQEDGENEKAVANVNFTNSAPVITITASANPPPSERSPSSPSSSPTSTNPRAPDSPHREPRAHSPSRGSPRVPLSIDLFIPPSTAELSGSANKEAQHKERALSSPPLRAHVKQQSLDATTSASGTSGGPSGNSPMSLIDVLGTDPNEECPTDESTSETRTGSDKSSVQGDSSQQSQRGETPNRANTNPNSTTASSTASTTLPAPSPENRVVSVKASSCCPFKCRKPNFDTRVKDHWSKMSHLLNETHFTSFKKGEVPKEILPLIKDLDQDWIATSELKQKPNKSERELLVCEIVTTEQSYYLGLTILTFLYYPALLEISKHNKNIDMKVVDMVFVNLALLQERHFILLHDLEKRIFQWFEPGNDRIGDILCSIKPLGGPYRRYGTEFENGMRILEAEKSKNADLKRVFDQLDEYVAATTKLKFSDYYITPIQRVPRYVLLCRDLIKATPERHPDIADEENSVVQAGEEADIIAKSVNVAIKGNERMKKKQEVLDLGKTKRIFNELINYRKSNENYCYYFTDKDNKPLERQFLNYFEISNIYDLKQNRLGEKWKYIYICSDALFMGPFVPKKVSPCLQSALVPMQCMWWTETIEDRDREAMGNDINLHDFKWPIKFTGPEQAFIVGFKSIGDRRLVENEIIPEMGMHSNVTSKDDADRGVRRAGYKYSGDKGLYVGSWLDGKPHGQGSFIQTGPSNEIAAWYKGYWSSTLGCGFGKTFHGGVNGGERAWKDYGDRIEALDPYLFWQVNDVTPHDMEVILLNHKETCYNHGAVLIEKGKPNTKLIKLLRGTLEVVLESGNIRIDTQGNLLGETAVLPGSLATATVKALTEVHVVEVNVELLISIFQTEPGISKRFYCKIARNLANKLKQVSMTANTPAKVLPTSKPSDSDDGAELSARGVESARSNASTTTASSTPNKFSSVANASPSGELKRSASSELSKKKKGIQSKTNSSAGGEIGESKTEIAELRLHFGLDKEEVFFKSCAATMLGGFIKKVGRLYIFAKHVVFESTVFGSRAQEKLPFNKINAIELDEKKQEILIESGKGSKLRFGNIPELQNIYSVIFKLQQRVVNKEPEPSQSPAEKPKPKDSVGGDPRMRRTNSLTFSRKLKQEDFSSPIKKPPRPGTFISMGPQDWELLLQGAQDVQYQKGEVIVREGQQHQRIYQLSTGAVDIMKNAPEEPTGMKRIVTLYPKRPPEIEVFGELTFLDPDNQLATASVIAKEDCLIYIIEGWFINALLVDHPHLGGRFYSYLCSILANRVSEREKQQRINQLASQASSKHSEATAVKTDGDNANNNSSEKLNSAEKESSGKPEEDAKPANGEKENGVTHIAEDDVAQYVMDVTVKEEAADGAVTEQGQ